MEATITLQTFYLKTLKLKKNDKTKIRAITGHLNHTLRQNQ